MSRAARDHLEQTWQLCRQAEKWLRRSFERSSKPPYGKLSEAEWDQLEALSGRFARMVDLVINKLFRALDRYELEETGTLLDAANRAAKRGLVDTPDVLRDLKDLRNEIVHDYTLESLVELYTEIYQVTPVVLRMMEGIAAYLEKKHTILAMKA